MFKGSFVAIVTPFKNGKIDEKKLNELVEWHISEGTDGFVPAGTTGESPTLSHKEHADVIRMVIKAARKRVPVIAGAGSNSTDEAIQLSEEAKKMGADGLLSVNPYYNRPTQEGLKAHFGAIAKNVSLPIVLYNIPSRSAVNLTPDTIADLSRAHKNIVGVKESTGSMDQTTEVLQKARPGFFVLSGDDSLTLPLMSIGAQGVISVAANLVPGDVSKLCHAFLDGNLAEAQRLHAALYPLIKALFIETNPAPVKAAMKEVGLIANAALRLPLVSLSNQNFLTLKKAMKSYGL